jgi:titin
MPEVGLLQLEQGVFFLNDSGTTVDFSTQTVNKGDTNPSGPEIGIYGLEPGGQGIAAIYVNGDNCVIKGLGYVSQRGYAVRLVGNQNRVIGCQVTGPLNAAVSIEGYMGGPTPTGNIIGGTSPGEGNSLSSVRIAGPAEGNIIIGNIVTGGGIVVQGAPQYGVVAMNNRIGGPSIAERNVISGAGAYGEEGFPVGSQVKIVDADGTIVEGNYIGTTVDGMQAYSPQIGPYGVEVRDARNTTIRGNLIAGERVVGTNHYMGQIFGEAIHVDAVNFDSQTTLIQANWIGLAADRVTGIVTRSGIVVSPLSTIHHAFNTSIDSNHIARVEKAGVSIASQENGVKITRNSIHDCGALGIDLIPTAGTSGVTPNDPGDGDIGANGLQNFPVLQSAAIAGSTVAVQGTLDSSAFGQFTIEFFASPSCDPSGFGEGAVFIGSTLVTTDGAGRSSFALSLPSIGVAAGARMTATARRVATNDTSEFSGCVQVVTGPRRHSGRDVTIGGQ